MLDFNKIFKRSISGGDRQNKQENTSLHEQSALVRSLIEEYKILSEYHRFYLNLLLIPMLLRFCTMHAKAIILNNSSGDIVQAMQNWNDELNEIMEKKMKDLTKKGNGNNFSDNVNTTMGVCTSYIK